MRISDWSSDVCSSDLGTRDGSLMVVNRSLTMMAGATKIAPTMQAALDDWENVAPALGELFEALERNDAEGALPFDADLLAAPLPRAFGWIDGTSYLAHMERARSLRGVSLPRSEEHTSELQSLMRLSYAVFCLK